MSPKQDIMSKSTASGATGGTIDDVQGEEQSVLRVQGAGGASRGKREQRVVLEDELNACGTFLRV